jgi:hypothetical protein
MRLSRWAQYSLTESVRDRPARKPAAKKKPGTAKIVASPSHSRNGGRFLSPPREESVDCHDGDDAYRFENV